MGFAAGIIYFAIQHNRTERHFQKQMAASLEVNNAQLWLSFREFLSKYDDIYVNLHYSRKEESKKWQPNSPEERVKLETYIGLFEHANKMLDMKLIDLETFLEIYEHRIKSMISNNWINTNEIDMLGEFWLNFIRLCHKAGLGRELPCRWKSVEMVKPELSEFEIISESLKETIYKGVGHNIIIRVVDKATKRKSLMSM